VSEVDDVDEVAIKETAAVIHTAGADSVYSIVQSFVLAMSLYPEAQMKAHAEIDRVVGEDADTQLMLEFRPKLAYIECVFLETLRWARSVPLGLAHELRQDDIYNDMFLPAKSVVIANIWGISRDEQLYEKPDEFLPERFEKGKIQDPRAFIFGFGRRACAGKGLAEELVWIAIASILASMNISKAIDCDGKEIVPRVEYTSGLICNPRPFVCSIQPRSGSL